MNETEKERLERMGMLPWTLDSYEKELIILYEIKELLVKVRHRQYIEVLIGIKITSVEHVKMRIKEKEEIE